MRTTIRRWTAALGALLASGLVVAASPASAAAPPLTITTTSLPTAYEGNSYNAVLHHSGGAGAVGFAVIAVDGHSAFKPPNGLQLTINGTIHGTVGADIPHTSITFEANDTEANTQVVTFTVPWSFVRAAITTTTIPVGHVGATYPNTKVNHVGCGTQTSYLLYNQPPYPAPGGLKISTAGVLSGSPTTTWNSNVLISVSNAPATRLNPNVRPCLAELLIPLTILPMTITTSALADAHLHKYYTETLVAAGGKPTLRWTVASGALPPGIKLGTAGQVAGTPTATGVYTATVLLSDGSTPTNTATRTLTLTVDPS